MTNNMKTIEQEAEEWVNSKINGNPIETPSLESVYLAGASRRREKEGPGHCVSAGCNEAPVFCIPHAVEYVPPSQASTVEEMIEELRSWAQNEEMIDQYYTEHGRFLNRVADYLSTHSGGIQGKEGK